MLLTRTMAFRPLQPQHIRGGFLILLASTMTTADGARGFILVKALLNITVVTLDIALIKDVVPYILSKSTIVEYVTVTSKSHHKAQCLRNVSKFLSFLHSPTISFNVGLPHLK